MKTVSLLMIAGLVLMIPVGAHAQQKSLSSTLEMYVFPTKGQEAKQQSEDETACYSWAVSNTGSDPFELQKQASADAQQSQAEKQAAQQVGQGAGAKGAVGGAAMGALIGEIADDDASKGAAYGAAIGAVAARRRGRAANQQAQAQAAQQSQQREQATAEQMDSFRKAFSVCLEAKDYMVKY